MITNPLAQRLEQGLSTLQLESDARHLLAYLNLLVKWNRAYNLTAIKNPIDMVDKHLLDSLTLVPYVQGQRLLDVGTGAGLPGIPLAISLPNCHFTLLDSNGKKTRFLQAVKRELSLDNVDIVQDRVEALIVNDRFDCITSRAFSDLHQMLQYTSHLLKPDGLWLAMKGRQPTDELEGINQPYVIHECTVPNLQQSRCVVAITQSGYEGTHG